MDILIAIALFGGLLTVTLYLTRGGKPGDSLVNTLYTLARWAMAVASASDHWVTEYRRVKTLNSRAFVALQGVE